MIAIAIAGSITAAVAAGLALSGGDRKRREPTRPEAPADRFRETRLPTTLNAGLLRDARGVWRE